MCTFVFKLNAAIRSFLYVGVACGDVATKLPSCILAYAVRGEGPGH